MNLKPNIDKVLSGYNALRAIGRGGMATIYLYENRLTGELLAVKSMHSQAIGDPESLNRFFHEVQASTRLDHRNIVKVIGYGELDGHPAMVMEYVDGGDLKNLMDRIGVLPIEIACYILIQIFKGLDYSHRLGIIHRDIKPSNILMDRSGTIKITDFGVSRVADLTRLTHTGDVLGTPAYMSPEQASGESVDERSDLFSTGVLLYEMLTNVNPFVSENPSVTLLNIIRCNPTPVFERNPTIPFKLEMVIERIFEREPANRISSAAECATALREVLREVHNGEFTQEMFQQFITSPDKYVESRRIEQSFAFCEKGKSIYRSEKDHPELAAIEFYRSLYLDPSNQEAKQFLTSITEKFTAAITPENAKKTLELEELLKASPTNVPVLLQLIKRCRADGNFIKAVFYSKRMAKLRPKDPYILSQIETLLPRDHPTGITIDTDNHATLIQHIEPIRRKTQLPGDRAESMKPASTPAPKPLPVKREFNTGWLILALFILIIGVSIYVAQRFTAVSDKMVDTIPDILNEMKTRSSDSSETDRRSDSARSILNQRQRELLEKAQLYFKSGDKQKTLEHYLLFIDEFPDHPETINLRLQISNLYFADGNTEQAIKHLDAVISADQSASITAIARFRKVKMLIESGNGDDARWECRSLEPNVKQLPNVADQIQFLQIYANLCESSAQGDEALRIYDRIILEYTDRTKVAEIRLLKADLLIRQGNLLDAQRELWIVRDQSRQDTLIYKVAVEKLAKLGLDSEHSGESELPDNTGSDESLSE